MFLNDPSPLAQRRAEDPGCALAHAELAEAYVKPYGLRCEPGAIDLARGNSDHALALDPALVDAHLVRAILLEETGKNQEALNEFARALALDPSNPATLLAQAHLYVRLNRSADAEQTYHRLVTQRPNYWLAYNEMGVLLHEQGKFKRAVEAFRTATVAAPRSSLAFANLDGEYLDVGEFAQAPFEFTVGGKLLPADTYTITSASPGVVMVQSADKRLVAMTTTSHGNQQSVSGSKLVFDKYGSRYFLHQIVCPETTSLNVDIPKSKTEKQVERQEAMLGRGQLVLVTAK